MARAIYYPPANRTAQWFHGSYRGADIHADKVVWHTTETRGWPGYGGGASAPHWTYDPVGHSWRQHYRADRSARALRNASGGVETNTDDCLQVEIIAYSDEDLGRSVGGTPVSELDDRALRDLGDFARWAEEEWGVPLTLADDWRPAGSGALRFSFAEWRAFTGHCGHIHVPENTHWDPGRLDVWTIIDYARGGGMAIDRDDVKTLAKTDGIFDAPPSNPNVDKNPHWHLNSHIRNITEHVMYQGAEKSVTKPYWPDETIKVWNATRWTHSRVRHLEPIIEKMAEQMQAVADSQLGADADEIKAHIDARYQQAAAERQGLAERLDQATGERAAMLDLLEQHADGNLDEVALVDGIRDLLHQATAPDANSDDGG